MKYGLQCFCLVKIQIIKSQIVFGFAIKVMVVWIMFVNEERLIDLFSEKLK